MYGVVGLVLIPVSLTMLHEGGGGREGGKGRRGVSAVQRRDGLLIVWFVGLQVECLLICKPVCLICLLGGYLHIQL